MSFDSSSLESASLEVYLLDRIDYATCLELQHRLTGGLAERCDGQMSLLLCEHTPLVTVGRSGAATEVSRENGLIRSGQIPVIWTNRGGQAILHGPGQLAIYPLIPLRWQGMRLGDMLQRFQSGLQAALAEMAIPTQPLAEYGGLLGRTGQLAAFGLSVRNWVTYHGAYLNVNLPRGLLRLIRPTPGRPNPSTLVAERGPGVRMSTVRTSVVRHIASAFGCEQFHLHTGHPDLRRAAGA